MRISYITIVLEKGEFEELEKRIRRAKSGYISNIDFERILVLERIAEVFEEAILEEINGGEEDYETE